MKRLPILCALAFLAIGCNSNGNLVQPTWDVVNMESEQFKQLSVAWGGAVSPDFVITQIDLTSDEVITLTMQRYNNDKMQNQCSGNAMLKLQDYEKIVSLVSSTNLFNYQPTADCKPLVGTQGVDVSYTRNNGTSNHFNTACEIDPKIDNLLNSVDSIADANITDCSWELLMQEVGEATASSGT